MKISDLPARYQDQAAAKLAEHAIETLGGDVRSQRVARSDVMLQCAKCDLPPTSNLSAMERHCDAEGHHRYDVVLHA